MEIAPRDSQVYYELSWAILSTIGLLNLFIGGMVVGIAGYSPITLVPLVVSAAGALANGMCYYAYYANYPVLNTAIASGFADLSWLVQEAGLSFYSFVILRRVLRNRSRLVFLVLFWLLIFVIAVLRITILACRVRYILGHSSAADLQRIIDHLHVGYFASIAVVEILSSVFLLRKFNTARKISMKAAMKNGLFSYLMRSTEIRLALLALIGVTRAITYSFQDTAQSATSVASEFDRFAYTLECMFPMIMYIDILASRLIFHGDAAYNSSRSAGASRSRGPTTGPRQFTQSGPEGADVHMYPLPKVERHIEVHGGYDHSDEETATGSNGHGHGGKRSHGHRSANRGGSQVRTSSQEYIIDDDGTRSRATNGSDFGEEVVDLSKKSHGGISKTVEFKVVEAREV